MKKSPVTNAFFATSIIGLIISVHLTYTGNVSYSLGFASTLVFIMMFIASFVSMTPTEEELEELDKRARKKYKLE